MPSRNAKRRSVRRPRKRLTLVRRVRRAGSNMGTVYILRKTLPMYVTNSLVAGIPVQSGGAGILAIGAPEPSAFDANICSLPFSFEFHLADLVNSNELVAIADRYKIAKVWVRAWYNATSQGFSAGAVTATPIIQWIQDWDDSSLTGVTSTTLRQKMGLRAMPLSGSRFKQISLRPRVAQLAYNGATPAFSVAKPGVWVNSTYANVPHYGLKGFIENLDLQTTSNCTSFLTFELCYSVVLKNLQ